MAITSYATLVDAIVDRMNNADLSTHAAEFIQLAEAMFNRRLFNLEAEGTSTATATATLALPGDFISMKSVYLNTDPRQPLSYMSADNARHYWASQTTGKPQNYSLIGNELVLSPSPDNAYTVYLTYQRRLVGLSAINTTNWLLEKHPDLYLYAALTHAEFRGWNDERLPMLSQSVDGIIAEINEVGVKRRLGGGMRMRPSVYGGI